MKVEGPKGKLTQSFLPDITIEIKENEGIVTRKNDSKRSKSLHGLYRNLLNNMVIGVSNGFAKTLLINGVGYRAEMGSGSIILNLGFSNPIEYPIPENIDIQIDGPNKIIISGIDKQQVGQVAAEIRSLRPPEPYKGKGVKYEDELVKRKVGKAGIK
jgi:large subunit ribosomal protein L6